MGIVMFFSALVIILLRKIVFNTGHEDDSKFLIVAAVVLIVVFGVRSGVANYGSDLNSYYRMYERAIEGYEFLSYSESSPVEIGYIMINWGLARVFRFPQFILFFQAFVCIGLTFRYINRYSSDPLFSVMGFMAFGLCQFYATGFRQAIAISMCLVAVDFAENRKMIRFVLTVLLAATIHSSAILFVFAYFLVGLPLNRITMIAVATIMAFFGNSLPYFIKLGNDLFEKSYSGVSWGNAFGGAINILVALFVVVPIFLLSRNNGEHFGDLRSVDVPTINYELVLLLIAGVGLYAMRYRALVIERVSLYYTSVLFILLPQVVDTCFVESNRKFLRTLFYFGMLFLIYWRFNTEQYIPFWVRLG